MKPSAQNIKPVTLDIVGSNKYGRYPKISIEKTINMIESDGFMVPYAGYKKVFSENIGKIGRGIFTSISANLLILVFDNKVYTMNSSQTLTQIGLIATFDGNIFIDENNAHQIAICDQKDLWIYNYKDSTFKKSILPNGVIPGYVTYQDTYFIIPDLNSNEWFLSAPSDGTTFLVNGQPVAGAIQTKGDLAQAVLRVPGKGNLLLVFGKVVGELWTDLGQQIFPYKRSSTVNIDYGILNSATLDQLDNYVCWLGGNGRAAPVIMYSTGGDIHTISNDGINFQLENLNHPEKSGAFFFKQNGHLFYQITFYDPSDNLTLVCDFTNKFKFYTMTDEHMNYHIAKRLAYFNNQAWFISYNDGNIYLMGTSYPQYDYGLGALGYPQIYEIPMIRVCKNIRLPDSTRFVINQINMTIEMGDDPTAFSNMNPHEIPRVDLSIALGGSNNFSSSVSQFMNFIGNSQNRLVWWNQGIANDFVPQFRFWGMSRFVVTNGEVSMYQ